MKKGFTLVEILVAMSIISSLGIGIAIFLFQTYVIKDKVDSLSSTQRSAQIIMERLNSSIAKGSTLNVTNSGLNLTIQGPEGCDIYSLVNQILYLNSSSTDICPPPDTTTPLHDQDTKITNQLSPTIVLFTGLPTSSEANAILVKLRASNIREFAKGEFYVEQTISKRL